MEEVIGLLDAADKEAAQAAMPISLRTRAAYLRRMLKRLDENREGYEKMVAQSDGPIARFLVETNDRYIRELTEKLKAVEAEIENSVHFLSRPQPAESEKCPRQEHDHGPDEGPLPRRLRSGSRRKCGDHHAAHENRKDDA